jgi:tRNA (cytidine/uridine-2'-O-)-methyltransferase
MQLNIVLVEPEIPQNTGNIARTCAATGTMLHLVRPLNFFLDDKNLKRAGLDYWKDLNLCFHDSLEIFLENYKGKNMFFVTTKGKQCYTDIQYTDECYLLFGKETAGLPEWLLEANPDYGIRIPMLGETRSLNLSNSVAILTYEYYRQKGFAGLA